MSTIIPAVIANQVAKDAGSTVPLPEILRRIPGLLVLISHYIEQATKKGRYYTAFVVAVDELKKVYEEPLKEYLSKLGYKVTIQTKVNIIAETNKRIYISWRNAHTEDIDTKYKREEEERDITAMTEWMCRKDVTKGE